MRTLICKNRHTGQIRKVLRIVYSDPERTIVIAYILDDGSHWSILPVENTVSNLEFTANWEVIVELTDERHNFPHEVGILMKGLELTQEEVYEALLNYHQRKHSSIPKGYVGTNEVAALTGRDITEVRKMIKTGIIPGSRFGKLWICELATVERWMHNNPKKSWKVDWSNVQLEEEIAELGVDGVAKRYDVTSETVRYQRRKRSEENVET